MKYRAMTFGAVLWDVINGKEHIGGAPFNLAAQLHQLGFDSILITGIGNDERGVRIRKLFSSLGMNPDYVQTAEQYETGYAEAAIDPEGIPSYHIPAETAFDHISYIDALDETLRTQTFDLLCYGTFDQRSQQNRETLSRIWESIRARIKFYDVNLRKPYYTREIIEESLKQADLVKMNDDELLELSHMLYGKTMNEKDFFSRLSDDFSLKVIVETRGKKGCTVWDRNKIAEAGITGTEEEVVADTVGAGDAFSAGFLWSYCRGLSTIVCAENGNTLGTHVARSPGAVPPLNDDMKRKFAVTS
jgi:fructokinase